MYKYLENSLFLCPKATLATLAENKAAIKVGFLNIEIPISKKIEKQPIISQEGICPKCGKKHIDLREKMIFEPQKGRSDCNITCKRIMKKMGVVPEGATIKAKKYPFNKKGNQRYESYYQLADEDETRKKLIFRDYQMLEEANDYLDKSLEYGHPILVGVNHTFDYRNLGYCYSDIFYII